MQDPDCGCFTVVVAAVILTLGFTWQYADACAHGGPATSHLRAYAVVAVLNTLAATAYFTREDNQRWKMMDAYGVMPKPAPPSRALSAAVALYTIGMSSWGFVELWDLACATSALWYIDVAAFGGYALGLACALGDLFQPRPWL